jgi:uncharacterized protein (DUF2147 family)
MIARRIAALSGFAALAVGPALADAPQPPVGRWLTEGGAGVIELSSCGAALCGRVVGIRIDHPDDPTPVDWRGEPDCGLTILRLARRGGEAWFGRITDPRNGNVWRARLAPAPDGTLHLRGYLFFPLFGQTQVWTRYVGAVPPDCRLQDTGLALRG